MRVLSKGFAKLKLMLPWVPPDTKLSKLDTLRLATSYISHLQRVLDDNGDEYSSGNDTKYQTPSLVRNLLFLTVSSSFAVTYRNIECTARYQTLQIGHFEISHFLYFAFAKSSR